MSSPELLSPPQEYGAAQTFAAVYGHLEQTFDLRSFAATLRAPGKHPVSMASFERPLPYSQFPGVQLRFFGAAETGVMPTPVETLAVTGTQRTYDKREDLHQPGRNYKIHGARYALLHALNAEPSANIMATASAGNHGISLAVAAMQVNAQLPVKLHRKAHVYCRDDISPVKERRLHQLGAVVHAEHQTLEEAVAHSKADVANNPDAVYIPPFDHPLVIAGQAILTFSTFAQLKSSGVDLSRTNFLSYEPVGGGGKAAGAAFAMRKLVEWGVIGEESAVIGVEVEQNDSNARALENRPALVPRSPGVADGPNTLDTDCEGTATIETGVYTLPMLQQFTDGISVIPKDFLVEACGKLMQAHEGTPPELAGALSLGGLLYDIESGKERRHTTHHVMTTTTGANVSRELLMKVARDCLDASGSTINSRIAALNLRRYAEGHKAFAPFKSGDHQEQNTKSSGRPVLRVWRGMQNG